MKKPLSNITIRAPSSLSHRLEDLPPSLKLRRTSVSFGSGEKFMRSSMLCIKDDDGYKKIIFVTDQKIWKNCERFFPKNFAENFDKFLLLKDPQADEKNLKKIAEKVKSCDLILVLGSGVINDLCKFTSAEKNIPYAIFASAASMNGYLSKNASIAISGHKKTLPATLPIKVFCNLEILKAAPLNLTKAGIGDSLCFYSCWFDWYLSHKILGTKFDEKPFAMLKEKMDFLLKNYQKFSAKDEKFLQLLLEILLLSGAGMTMAGGSYPASQSEHMIAHTIEMKYPKIVKKLLHGQMIAVTTLTSSKIQSELLDRHRDTCAVITCGARITSDLSPRLHDRVQKELKNFFGKKIAAQCLTEYKEKISLQKNAKKLDQKTIKELQKIHLSADHLKQIFSHFKIKTSYTSLGLFSQEYQACISFAKFTRNRFTALDLSSCK